MMKSTALIVTTALLIGCSSSLPKPQNSTSMEDKLYLSMGIQKDPNEKNPIFYEIPGRWKAKGTDQDCENNWTQLTISKDKKLLIINQETSEKANIPIVSKSLPFKIEKATRTSLSLKEQSTAAESWEIKMPTLIVAGSSTAAKKDKVEIPLLTVFSLTSQNDPNFSLTYARCIKNMEINVGESVTIQDVDLSEALEKADQR